jgi:glycerol-3-phosphate acyltransferase PlsY
MFALAPLAALIALAACVLVSVATAFRYGARVGVFGFPLVQLALDPVAHVIGTGVLMTLIGLLFLARRRTPARATSAPGAPPTA